MVVRLYLIYIFQFTVGERGNISPKRNYADWIGFFTEVHRVLQEFSEFFLRGFFFWGGGLLQKIYWILLAFTEMMMVFTGHYRRLECNNGQSDRGRRDDPLSRPRLQTSHKSPFIYFFLFSFFFRATAGRRGHCWR